MTLLPVGGTEPANGQTMEITGQPFLWLKDESDPPPWMFSAHGPSCSSG